MLLTRMQTVTKILETTEKTSTLKGRDTTMAYRIVSHLNPPNEGQKQLNHLPWIQLTNMSLCLKISHRKTCQRIYLCTLLNRNDF